MGSIKGCVDTLILSIFCDRKNDSIYGNNKISIAVFFFLNKFIDYFIHLLYEMESLSSINLSFNQKIK